MAPMAAVGGFGPATLGPDGRPPGMGGFVPAGGGAGFGGSGFSNKCAGAIGCG